MALAFIVSLVVSIPLAFFMAGTPRRQRILLPIADILQSVPVLAFFPVLAAFFVAYNAFELATVLVIFLSMVWNIVFPLVGGLQTIPDDVKSAALVFHVRSKRKLLYINLPALFPFIVTGSLLAWAQGWTIVIVAEGFCHPSRQGRLA
jgi:NitT/TauT family transport system permease protein